MEGKSYIKRIFEVEGGYIPCNKKARDSLITVVCFNNFQKLFRILSVIPECGDN
jgi:hypothetical protein